MHVFIFYRDEVADVTLEKATLPSSVLEAWSSLPAEVRAALVSSELSSNRSGITARTSSVSISSLATSSSNSSDSGSKSENDREEIEETCPKTGAKMVMTALERAPENVFAFTKTSKSKKVEVKKEQASLVTTKTTVVTTGRGWRNVFSLPISYDVNMVAHGTLLDPTNPQLLEATGIHPEGYNRRFAVIDAEVDRIYGDKIRNYFVERGIELTTCILSGGEADKRPAVSGPAAFYRLCLIID